MADELDIEKIRQLREKLKLTQEEAARRAGQAGRSWWSGIESGARTDITLATLRKVAEVLGVRARDLLR